MPNASKEITISYSQADSLLSKILEKFLSSTSTSTTSTEKEDKSARVKISKPQNREIHITTRKTIAHAIDVGENAVGKLIGDFWTTNGTRKEFSGAKVEETTIPRRALAKMGEYAFPDSTDVDKDKQIDHLLKKLSPSDATISSPKIESIKVRHLQNGSFKLFCWNEDSIENYTIKFHPNYTLIVEIDVDEPIKGRYRKFNDDKRYVLVKLQDKETNKDFWHIIFDLFDDPLGTIPDIILGSSYRFSSNGELTSGVAILAKISEMSSQESNNYGDIIKSSITAFLRRQEYEPIKIPKHLFKDISALREWHLGHPEQNKTQSLSDDVLKNLTGEYVYFTSKAPVEKGEIREFHRFIKARIDINIDGSVHFFGKDNRENEVRFNGICNYSSEEIIQIVLFEEGGGRFLTLQLYATQERLRSEKNISPLIGISLWKEDHLEGKIIALIRKNPDDKCEDLGIINVIPNNIQEARGKLNFNDNLYEGALSYLSGKTNRYLHTPKQFHKGPFRPHQENHRRLYFGLAYYLVCRKPDGYSPKKVEYALHEAYLHGFAASHFAGKPLKEAIKKIKSKTTNDGRPETLYNVLAQELESVLKEQEELKLCFQSEMQEFLEFAKKYWDFL
jgi:hypothetical protein